MSREGEKGFLFNGVFGSQERWQMSSTSEIRDLNRFIRTAHLKMEGIQCEGPVTGIRLANMTQSQGHIFLGCSACIPPKVLRFRWQNTSYQFTCLSFELSPTRYLQSSGRSSADISSGQPHTNQSHRTLMTIAMWLKDMIGVDTSCFSGHSNHSSLAAALLGMTTADIMQRAGWSQGSIFSRFYPKRTVGESNAAHFSSAVLEGKCYDSLNMPISIRSC